MPVPARGVLALAGPTGPLRAACTRRARAGGAGGRWQPASAQLPPGHGSSLSARRACSVKSTRLRDPGPPSHGPWPWVSNAPFHVTGPGAPPKATGDCPAHPRFLARTRTLAVTRTLMSQHLTTVPRHGNHYVRGCVLMYISLRQPTTPSASANLNGTWIKHALRVGDNLKSVPA